MKKQTIIWVAPEFKKKLKSESALEGVSMIEYTKMLAKTPSVNQEIIRDEKKKRGFRLDF